MGEHAVEPGNRPADILIDFAQRQMQQRPPPVRCHDCIGGFSRIACCPASNERNSDGAAKIQVSIKAAPCRRGSNGNQPRRFLCGGLPLCGTHIRTAPHPNPPVAPRLLPQPLDCVVSILPFIVVGYEITFGFEPATTILDNHDVTRCRISLSDRFRAVLVVRRPHQ